MIQDGEIRIEHVTARIEDRLRRLGGESVIEGGGVWTIPYDGEQRLANLLGELNRLGILFAGGPAGWPPSAIFEDLRERGLARGSFKELVWTGPGNWFVRDR